MERVIMHVDMDAFFASVEQKDNPQLKGKPVIVGGKSERGVVCTCSYEARKYGVHSAMPGFMARKKCPFGIFMPVRYGRYKELSKEIFNILYSFTELVEPVSIDEAYLDISHIEDEPMVIAKKIKETVRRETGLTISVGISYNKFLAKLASDWNKPDGIKIITEDMIPKILFPLPIKNVHGLGKKSVERLNGIGIYTIEDLYSLPKEICLEYFGKSGIEIYYRIRGIDNREIKLSREVKSIGKESTLKEDTKNREAIKNYLHDFSTSISSSLKKRNLYGKTVTVKIKTSSFQIHTKSKTLNTYIRKEKDIYECAVEILDEIDLKENIRLIGLSISNLTHNIIQQMSFNDFL